MAPRPNWKGYLKLSLVSCPVALYPATTTSQRIHFHVINRQTGNRIRNDIIDAETGQPVEPEDRVKGYEVEKGQYVLVEEEELDNVALESTHTIDIEQFVPMAEVDRIYLDESFYLVPQDEMAQEAFAVIREAMRKDDLVGLARLVIYRREHLLLLAPRGKGIMATALRYKTEVRDEKNYFDEIENIKVPADMLKLARADPERQEGPFRSVQVRRPLRARADGADQGQARRQEAAGGERRAAEQCDQSDGCVAPQRARRRPPAGARARRKSAGGRKRADPRARKSGARADRTNGQWQACAAIMPSDVSTSRKSRAASSAKPATNSSSRSMPPAGCITISGCSSTAS